MPDETDDTIENAIDSARAALQRALLGLPYATAGPVPTPPVSFEGEEEVAYLAAVAVWIVSYGQTVDMMASTTSAMHDELERLRHERAVIRRFLGTSPGEVFGTPDRQSEREHD